MRTDVTVTYLVDRYYDPDDELGIVLDDPAVSAEWGVDHPILSRATVKTQSVWSSPTSPAMHRRRGVSLMVTGGAAFIGLE